MTLFRRIASIVILLIPIFDKTFAQNTAAIDKQVWTPFLTSYSTWDYEMFNSVHSDHMIRINSKEIRNASYYKDQNKEWFIKAKAEGYLQFIDLRFEKRIVTGDMAFETGYYKIKITKPNGEKSDYYARFHILLKQEAGVWKIIQDWDSSTINGQKVTSADFDKLEPSNLINK